MVVGCPFYGPAFCSLDLFNCPTLFISFVHMVTHFPLQWCDIVVCVLLIPLPLPLPTHILFFQHLFYLPHTCPFYTHTYWPHFTFPHTPVACSLGYSQFGQVICTAHLLLVLWTLWMGCLVDWMGGVDGRIQHLPCPFITLPYATHLPLLPTAFHVYTHSHEHHKHYGSSPYSCTLHTHVLYLYTFARYTVCFWTGSTVLLFCPPFIYRFVVLAVLSAPGLHAVDVRFTFSCGFGSWLLDIHLLFVNVCSPPGSTPTHPHTPTPFPTLDNSWYLRCCWLNIYIVAHMPFVIPLFRLLCSFVTCVRCHILPSPLDSPLLPFGSIHC